MRAPLTILAALLAGGGCGGGCNNPGPFPDDSCDDPAAYTLDSLEIGAGEDDLFAPLVDGEIRPIAEGSQGGQMVTVTLRMTGAAVPACIAQSTSLVQGDMTFGSDDAPKRTYAQDDGGYTTRYIYVQFYDLDSGDSVHLRTQAAGQTDEVLIYLDFIGTPDASVPDGGTDAMIDGGPDAG